MDRDEELDDWDKQLDSDAASGALDFLLREAEQAAAEGTLREWPPPDAQK